MTRTLKKYGIELKPLSQEFVEQVRVWRNHPEVARYMVHQETISPSEQEQWFKKISASNQCEHYLIFYKETPVGLIYIESLEDKPLNDSRVIEPGMYLAYDSPYRGTFLAFCPALALNDHCFETLGCDKLVAKVKKENDPALRFNTTLGYVTAGEADGLVKQELEPKGYRAARDKIKRFIRF